jgi:hypothetical protein
MLLTCDVSNTLSVLLVFDTWKEISTYGKNWHRLHISRDFLTLNSWYLHLLVYYKHMLNFQWGLFCRLRFRVTFFKLLHIKTWHELFLHMIFLGYSKGVLEHTFDIFTNFSRHCDLILCKSKIYHFLTHYMFIITIWM